MGFVPTASPARRALAICTLAWLSPHFVGTAWADPGTSDERISLPDGPGSVAGAGENLTRDGNLGAMTYQLALKVPPGHPGATPELPLSYNSMGGNELLGMGWNLRVPSIERFTRHGLPRYDANDRFAVDGGQELAFVTTHEDGTREYRARFEGSFVRYFWRSVGTGATGYWEAFYPDGSRSYFGADPLGQAQPDAVASGPAGQVFRYMLVETLDVLGHRVRYTYAPAGARADLHSPRYPLVREVHYVFRGDSSRYSLTLDYETRTDQVVNGRPGFTLRLGARLATVTMRQHGQTVRSYAFRYRETESGMSRLSKLERYGTDGSRLPFAHRFQYTRALDLDCENCEQRRLFSMGNLAGDAGGGVDFKNARATLIDMNGDALPDVLDTSEGVHRIYFNQMAANGQQSFSQATPSHMSGTSFRLDEARVQAVDIDGDGFTDIFHTGTGDALCNTGTGEWIPDGACRPPSRPGELAEGAAGDSDPEGARFFDYDGDKRMDLLLAATGTRADIWHNRETPTPDTVGVPLGLGRGFNQDDLQLADLNGDGLLDLIVVTFNGQVWSRLYLGHGQWTPPLPEQHLSHPKGVSDLSGVTLEDLNGDGLDDLVLVRGRSVHIALNRFGQFSPFQTLSTSQSGAALPDSSALTVSVLFADMNGSGTTDIVWFDAADGSLRVLEFFDIRPHLLQRVENGLGGIVRVEYTTSPLEQARDLAEKHRWHYPVPQPLNVVSAVEHFTTWTPHVVDREEYRYHHGYYHSGEKRYLGFAQIETRNPGDAHEETSLRVTDYHVGADDVYRAGRVHQEHSFSGEQASFRPLWSVTRHYAHCPLSGIDDDLPTPVRFVCETQTDTVLKEGRPEAEWVQIRTTQEHDGFGQALRAIQHGVVGRGAKGELGCGPCDDADANTLNGACDHHGALCLGDEAYVESEYIQPTATERGGVWLLGRPFRTRRYGRPGGPHTETLNYYDGPAFEGLKLGTLERGLISRMCRRVTPEAADGCQGPGWVQAGRAAYDAHGNVLTELDPLGAPDDHSGHRRQFEYDAEGLRLKKETRFLSADGAPYQLARRFQHHPVFDSPVTISRWRVLSAPVDSSWVETQIVYDVFGRRSRVALPGDSLQAPTHAFEYRLGDPVSRLVTRSRPSAQSSDTVEQIACMDGWGRTLQTRTRLTESVFQVNGFHEVSPRGLPMRAFQAYQGGEACEATAPRRVRSMEYRYDGAGRALEVIEPSQQLYGTPSRSRIEYRPLVTTNWDAEDLDSTSPAHGTPTRRTTDGLSRVILLERPLTATGPVGSVRVLWDSLGRLAGHINAAGNRKQQGYDLLGRVLEIRDPNAGHTHMQYDAAGNVTRKTDALGRTIRFEYDGLNRPTARLLEDQKRSLRAERRYDFDPTCAQQGPECAYGAGTWTQTDFPFGPQNEPGRDRLSFDARGRRVHWERRLGSLHLQRRTAYDKLDRPVSHTYPDGTQVQTRFDVLSRPTAIVGVVDDIRYDERGALARVDYENGVEGRYTYDALGRLSQRLSADATGRVLQGFGYVRDRVGNVLTVKDLSSERTGRLRLGTHYELDAWYRTRSTDYDWGERLEFQFDLLDNLLAKHSSLGAASLSHTGESSYGAEKPNALRQLGWLQVDHDAVGQATWRHGTQLDWDALGRLLSAQGSRGQQAEYAYGWGAERIAEWSDEGTTYFMGADFQVRDGVASTYARLAGSRVARLSSDTLASILMHDTADDGHIDIGDAWQVRREPYDRARYLRAAARRLLLERDGFKVFLHSDHLGSLTLATDSRGRVRGERLFFPTGELARSAGYVDAHGFTGQRHDETTGLIHFQHRELDPATGRWLTVDPLFRVSTLAGLARAGEATTAYAYVAGNFSSSNDPTGLARRGRNGQSRASSSRNRNRNRNRQRRLRRENERLQEEVTELRSQTGVMEAFLAETQEDVQELRNSHWMALAEAAAIGGALNEAARQRDLYRTGYQASAGVVQRLIPHANRLAGNVRQLRGRLGTERLLALRDIGMPIDLIQEYVGPNLRALMAQENGYARPVQDWTRPATEPGTPNWNTAQWGLFHILADLANREH